MLNIKIKGVYGKDIWEVNDDFFKLTKKVEVKSICIPYQDILRMAEVIKIQNDIEVRKLRLKQITYETN